MKKSSITIKDIAKLSGYSIATVSRTVNQKPGVKPETKQKVLKIIEQYNYTPNIYAQGLVKGEVKNIGLIFPYNEDMLLDLYLTEITSFIENYVIQSGYDFTLYFPHSELTSKLEDQYLNLFKSKKISGLIIGGVQINDESVKPLANEGLPFILIGSYLNYLKYNFIDVDHRNAVKEAISYLISKGLKKIMYVGSSLLFSTPIEKYEGYKDALRQNDLKLSQRLVFHNIDRYSNAYSLCKELIEDNSLPDAFFCEHDMLAWGVINALLEHNIKIPDKVSVIGYNDINIAKYIYPHLSTVRLPVDKIAENAVKSLISLIVGKKKYVKSVMLKSKLIIRESSI